MNSKPSKLIQGLEALDIKFDDALCVAIEDYLCLLDKWSKTHNMTAITNPDDAVVKHILDSLAIWPHLQGKRFIDVGTGAGLPGLPLALLNSDQHWSLLDSLEKRMRFLTHVKHKLSLSNIEVINARVQDFQAETLFDGVVSRAFTSLSEFIYSCKHLLREGGCFYAMKGQLHDDELAEIPANYSVEIIPIDVPFLRHARHLIKIC